MSKLVQTTDLGKIVEALKLGAILAFPTDTVFGLGCSIACLDSIEGIKQIKARDPNKALPIMVDSVTMLEEIAILNDQQRHLIKTLGPGAITYILPKKACLDKRINNGMDTIAVRIPNNSFILEMIHQLGCPMAVTSANLSNQPSLFKVDDVIKQFYDQVDLIVNQDALSSQASTIYDCINDKILREGVITIEKIRSIQNVRSKIS